MMNKQNGAKWTKNTPKKNAINFEWIEKLVQMDFDYDKAFDAVSKTNSVGFNQALDYLMLH